MIVMATVSSLDVCNYAYAGEIEEVKSALECDSSLVHAKDSNKRTALHWACSSGQADITDLLIDSGANVSFEMYQFSLVN